MGKKKLQPKKRCCEKPPRKRCKRCPLRLAKSWGRELR